MKIFHKILIANRGEIAMRIIRSIRKLGLLAIAVYAENDRDAAHVAAADKACSLGDGPLSDTYLNIEKLIKIAKENGCDAIHPGYGFLSERPEFAQAVSDAGLQFIGPDAASIRLMGNKIEARKFVQSINVPVVEGRTGDPEELLAAAEELSFPLLIKAAAGGGGKGMRIVRKKEDLKDALEATAREATTYFGDGNVYAERYLENPRHIEVQVFGDRHGNAIHLFERECSLQRRYQKIIEEAPSPSVDESLRKRITEAALKITKGIAYSNAGTIEFLVENEKEFFFLEMNTRIQVEHPVSEMITGIDLVEEQILVAAGNPLSFKQEDISIHGHAIEARVYAEDPSRDFLPSPGQMSFCHLPQDDSVRVESGINQTLDVSADYDPMIAKVIVWGKDRNMAIEKMERTLKQTIIHGISSNVSFLLSLIKNEDYRENRISTKFCDTNLPDLLPPPPQETTVALAAYVLWWTKSRQHIASKAADNIWEQIGYWRNRIDFRFRLNEKDFTLGVDYQDGNRMEMILGETALSTHITEIGEHSIRFVLNDNSHAAWVSEDGRGNAWITVNGEQHHLFREDVLVEEDVFTGSGPGYGGDPAKIKSPMPGKVVKVMVSEGEEVKSGQTVLIVEAMKMENAIQSAMDGIVEMVNIQAGDKVDTSSILIQLMAEDS